MGKTLLISLAVCLGAALAVALVLMFSATPARQQLVGDRPLAYWLSCLDSSDDRLRASAATNLPAFGVDSARPLIERLDARDPGVASAAKTALSTLGPAAVPELARSLRSGSPARHLAAIELLSALGTASSPASSDIAALLDDPNVGSAAARYFVSFGPTSPAIDKACRVLGGIDQSRRLDAIRILSAVLTDPRAIEALVANARTTDRAVRKEIYLALAQVPNPPKGAIEVIVEKFADETASPTPYSVLLQIGAPAIPILAAQHNNSDEKVRLGSVKALGVILAQSNGSVVFIEPFANDPSKMVADHAKALLQSNTGRLSFVPPATQPVVPRPPLQADTDSAYVAIGKKFDPAGQDELAPFEAASSADAAGASKVEQNPVSVAPNYDAVAFNQAVEQLDDPNPIKRKQATEHVRAFYALAGPIPIDINAAPDDVERLRLVRLLPFSDDWRKYDLMILALREENLAIRRAAISAMSRSLKSPRIVEKLIQVLARDPSATIRADAAEVLSSVRDQIPVSRALRAAQSDPDAGVASAAREALR